MSCTMRVYSARVSKVIANTMPCTVKCRCPCGKNIDIGNYSEDVRRLSFPQHWPYAVTVEDLARYGFVYEGSDDCVRCFACNLILEKWGENDLAATEHYYFNRDCPFMNKAMYMGSRGDDLVFKQHSGVQKKGFFGVSYNCYFGCDGRTETSILNYEYFRRSTFDGSSSPHDTVENFGRFHKGDWRYPVDANDLARYGFTYYYSGDRAQCVYCGIVVEGWQNGDLAFIEHLQFNDSCSFLNRNYRLNVRYEDVETVLHKMESIGIPRNVSVSVEDSESPRS